MDCVEEGGEYYVLITLTGGSGNDSCTLYDVDGNLLETDLEIGDTYLAGPYDEGVSVNFTVEENYNDDCSVVTDTVTPDICVTEPEPCENPAVSVSVVDANGDAMDCVEEEGEYHVFIELTGGSGNDSYTVYDAAGVELETDLAADGTYLAGPFDEGDTVSFIVEGNDDDECAVTTDTVDPNVCDVEPEPCENPDVSVSVVDADEDAMDCVDEGGQYFVLLELTGGSGNDSYTVYDDGDNALETDLESGSTYLAGPYDEGVSVSFTVEGNDDDDCFVITDTIDPDICVSEPCEAPDSIVVSNITEDSADITWSGGSEEGFWIVAYGVAPYQPGVDPAQDFGDLYEGDMEAILTGLQPGTEHQVYVRSMCGESWTNLSGWIDTSFTTDALDEPCEDPYNDDAATSEVYISNIQIAGIGVDLGNTDYDFHYTSSQMSTDGYDLVDNPILTVYPGLESSYTVSSGPAGNTDEYYYSIWIDFNHDGCFDADERIIWSPVSIPNGEEGVENVPMTFEQLAAGSTYQARIRNSMMGSPLSEGDGDGEALDFTIDVITQAEAGMVLGVDNQVFTDFTYYPNPIENQLTLNAGTPIEQVEVYNLLGQKVIQIKPNALETNLDTNRLQSGVYLMNVTLDGNQKTQVSHQINFT